MAFRSRLVASIGGIAVVLAVAAAPSSGLAADGLWAVYDAALKGAKYVDLTHTITPKIPVWAGFAGSSFAPARAGADLDDAKTGDVFTYEKHGFEATEYTLRTDQLGTQLDPPAHWAPEYPAIDELPATYAIRPLVVISIAEQLKSNPNYALASRSTPLNSSTTSARSSSTATSRSTPTRRRRSRARIG
jgi:hypothetical protein